MPTRSNPRRRHAAPSPARHAVFTAALSAALAHAASARAQAVPTAPVVPPAGTTAATPPEALTAPRLLHFVQADYPAQARAEGLEANVVLELSVDAEGRVADARVAQGAGQGFDEAALAAAREFRFAPARRGATAIPARIRYRYHFTLRAAGAATTAPQGPSAVLRGVVRDASNHPIAGVTLTLRMQATTPGSEQTPATSATPGATPSAATPTPPEAQTTQTAQTAQTTQTDAAGAFRFELPRAGALTVTASAPGMREFRAEERVAERDDLQVVYRLQPATPVATAPSTTTAPRPRARDEGAEQGVTVRAQRPAREVTRTTLERREVSRIPGTGGDALRSIQNLPGLSRPPFFSGALIVRGSAPQDTQVFADGMPVPLLYHFGGLTSTIQNDMLDRIDFYPGNFSGQYGRAMGGIVDVGLRSPRTTGYHATANISLIDAGIFVEGAITPQLSFAVAVRRSYIDIFLNAILGNVVNVGVTAAPVYYDYQAVLEWRPNARNRLRLALMGDDDTLSILFQRPGNGANTVSSGASFANRYHLMQLLWTSDIAPGWQSRAMLSGGWTQLDLSTTVGVSANFDTLPFAARYELSHRLSSRVRVNAGLDAIFGSYSQSFDAQRVGGGSQGGQASATSASGGFAQGAAYLEAELTPVPQLRVVPALRFDYFEAIRRAVFAPRVSARWEFAPGWALRGGVGIFSQPPSAAQSSSAPNLLFPGQTLGNPALWPQRATHWSLAAEHQFSPAISLSVEGFYKTLDDLVVGTSTIARLQTPPAPPYLNTGAGRVYGLEVLLRHRATDRFFGWLAYTLMRAERQDGPGQDWHLYQYDQTHILTAIASYTLGDGWEIGARFRYVTGTPVTPIIGSFYNADSSSYVPVYGPPNSARNADFHQLDLRVDKGFRIGPRFRLGLFLEVLNVYNNSNQEGVQYNFDYTQRQPINGIPFFPNLGIRGEL